MKSSFILFTKIALMGLVISVSSVAYASEVVGTLSSSGVSNTTTQQGTTGVLSGTVVSGTVASNSSGGGGGGGGGQTVGANGPIVGSMGSGSLSSSITGTTSYVIESPPQTIRLAQGTSGDILSGAVAVDENTTAVVGEDTSVAPEAEAVVAVAPANQNTNQLAAVTASGIPLGAWYWWVLGLILVIAVAYYIFSRSVSQKQRQLRR